MQVWLESPVLTFMPFSHTNLQRLYPPVTIDTEYHYEAVYVETMAKEAWDKARQKVGK